MASYMSPSDYYSRNNPNLAQMAASYGMTTDQLTQYMAQQAGQYGSASVEPGSNMLQTLGTLGTINKYNLGGGGQQQSGGAPSSQAGQVSDNPMNAATNLGAAALGMPAIYNPLPMAPEAGAKGGVATIGSPTTSGTTVPGVPAGPWNNVASVFGQPSQQSQGLAYWQSQMGNNPEANAAQAASIEKAHNLAPGTIGNQFYQAGVQAGKIQPSSSYNPAPTSGGTPTPVTPANAPGAGQPATPWATAPPAPGATAAAPAQANWGAIMGGPPAAPTGGQMNPAIAAYGHTSALEAAGKAIYSHFGGDPSSATHADIANFHQTLNEHIGGLTSALTGGQVPGSNYTAGVQPGISAAGGQPPPKMATGGFVPGRGSQDTVPALLTPGEYVIPKQQAAQLFGGQQPIRMQDGGFVPDDQKRPSPESRHTALVAAAQGAQGGASSAPASTSTSGSSESANPSPSDYQGKSPSDWAQLAQQAQAAQAANANVGSGGAGSIDSLGSLGDESIITGQGGPGQPGGPGSATMAGAGAISDLAQGLTKAAQTYAASFKPWQIRPYQQVGNQVSSSQPAAQFKQDEVA